MDQGLRYAATDFCRRTAAYQTVETQSMTAGVAAYDLDIPALSHLSVILGVWVGGSELVAVATDDVSSGEAMREGGDLDGGTPRLFYQKVPSEPTIYLWPVPDAAADLTVRAAFEPTVTATSLPDLLYDVYANDIAAGAVAYLMAIPGQVFSNPGQVAYFAGRFAAAVGRAKATARAGDARRSMRVGHRAFA